MSNQEQSLLCVLAYNDPAMACVFPSLHDLYIINVGVFTLIENKQHKDIYNNLDGHPVNPPRLNSRLLFARRSMVMSQSPWFSSYSVSLSRGPKPQLHAGMPVNIHTSSDLTSIERKSNSPSASCVS